MLQNNTNTLTQVRLDSGLYPFLRDHEFQGATVAPGMLLASLAKKTAIKVDGSSSLRLRKFRFGNAIIVSENDLSPLSVVLEKGESEGFYSFSIKESESQTSYADGTIETLDTPTDETADARIDALDDATEIDRNVVYQRFRKRQNDYGPAFQGILSLKVSDGKAYATLAAPDADRTHEWSMDPCFLDWCIQVLAMVDEDESRTFALSGFEELVLYSPELDGSQVCARILRRDGDKVFGEIDVYSSSDTKVLSLKGVELSYLETHQVHNVVVSANYTAEPVEDVIKFWGDQFDLSLDLKFAPYNQVFQELLDPGSLFSRNEIGTNVLLLKLEEWIQEEYTLSLKCSKDEQDKLLEGKDRYALTPEVQIGSLNEYETRYLHTEIFVDRAYTRYGIDFKGATCVLDVGANIGLFSLFCESESPGVKVLSFEPSPPVYDILQTNVRMYAPGGKAFNIGLSGANGEANFTYYNNSSVFSTFHADEKEDHDAIEAVVKNVLEEELGDNADTDYYADALTEKRTESVSFVCQLRTVSHIIREENLDTIDILKVDAEKSELEVLRGIEDEHWPMIRHVVLEVHDSGQGEIEEATQILEKHGFNVSVVQEKLLERSGLYGVYGTRKDQSRQVSEQTKGQTPAEKLTRITEDFVQGLEVSQQRGGVPTLVCLTPEDESKKKDPETLDALNQAKALIERKAHELDGVHFISCEEMGRRYRVENCFDEQSNIMGHIPYTSEAYASVATEVFRGIRTLMAPPKKVLVLDCDNTLWKGVCGEQSVDELLIEEGHLALQRLAVECRDNGILVCLASKNEEADVIRVFESRDDMVLKWEHLSAWQIGWNGKSESMKKLAEDLNLGLDSFVFLDDNPVECVEVKAACPEVLTMRVPDDGESLMHFVDHLWALDRLQVTKEDRDRASFYDQEKSRRALQESTVTLSDFLDSLGLEVEVFKAGPEEYERTSQLTQRTNQFNFSTPRYSLEDIRLQSERDDTGWLLVRVKDRFGDYGIVGAAMYEAEGNKLQIPAFMVSCRVLGRGVEHKVLSALGDLAEKKDCEILVLDFRRSKKNEPALNFLLTVAGKDAAESLAGVAVGDQRSILISTNDALEATFVPSSVSQESQKSSGGAHAPVPASHHILEVIPESFSTGNLIQVASSETMMKPRPDLDTLYLAPESDMEKTIASVWCKVLRLERIGKDDDFFELGGTSLLAVQVASEMSESLGKRISTVALFEGKTVRAMAASLDGSSEALTEAKLGASSDRGKQRRAKRRRRGRT